MLRVYTYDDDGDNSDDNTYDESFLDLDSDRIALEMSNVAETIRLLTLNKGDGFFSSSEGKQ